MTKGQELVFLHKRRVRGAAEVYVTYRSHSLWSPAAATNGLGFAYTAFHCAHYLQGFVRMAIQHGAALVPIFAFGQAASFTWYRPGPPYVPRKLVEWVSRKAGALLFSMHGRSQRPHCCSALLMMSSSSLPVPVQLCAGAVPLIMHGRWMTPIPHSSPITIVVGRPIEVPRMDNPPDEVVQQHLEKFILAMQELFEKHKAACGCEDMTLTVM